MQYPLFADRMCDLAIELTDSRLDERRRVAAGDKLIAEIQQGHGDFADLAFITDSIALGMKTLKNEKRLPENPNDFVFTDEPLVRIAAALTAIGEQIEKLADHTQTQQDRDLVADFRRMHGIDDFRQDLMSDIKDHDLAGMTNFVNKISENSDGIYEATDELLQGQGVLLDIPMVLVAQFYFAAGHRLGQLTRYCKPLD